ncbi:hypothetical protein GCM10027601_36340 [Nocardioides ungokensis]
MVDSCAVGPLKPGDPERLGRFEIVGRIGAGGMGVAFLARTDAGEVAVVKTVQMEFADDGEARRRFRREVLSASAVESPFVPEVLASDVGAARQWVAIEYIEGPTLAELIAAEGPLPTDRQYALGAALADGIARLHANGLIHRDIKPSNIICTASGPRLIDFGIAVVTNLDGLTLTGALAPGSPGWMAPEQLDPHANPTPAIDVFAWGCVLWFAATGSSPVAGRTVAESLERLRCWNPHGLASPASLHSDLAPLVVRSLRYLPSDRGSAADIAASLSAPGQGSASELVASTWNPEAHTAALQVPTALQTKIDLEPTKRKGLRPLVAVLGAMTVTGTAVLAWSTLATGREPYVPTGSDKQLRASTGSTPSGPHREPSGPPADQQTTKSAPSTSPSTSNPSTSPSSPDVLPPLDGYGGARRVGYGPVKLGMTRTQLLATGEVVRGPTGSGNCANYLLRAGGTATFSRAQGRVVYIVFEGEMATSKGIRMGSPQQAAFKAYPDAPIDRLGLMYPPVVPPHVFYTIGFFGRRVDTIVLMSDRQDCAN